MNYDIAEVQNNAILRGYWLNQKNAPAERVRSISIDTSGIPRGLRRCHRGSRQASFDRFLLLRVPGRRWSVSYLDGGERHGSLSDGHGQTPRGRVPGGAVGLSESGVVSCRNRDFLNAKECWLRCPAVALIVSGNLKAEENGLPDAPPQFLVGFCLGVTAGEGGDRCHEVTILPAADNCLEGGEMWFHIGHDTAPAYKRQYFGNICADNSKFKNQNGK